MRAERFAWLLLLSLVGAGAVGGCNTEEGVTPKCSDPPLPLYDVTEGNNPDGTRENDAEQRAIDELVAAGCLTPIGTARSGNAPPPPASTAGAAGAAGAPGAGGAGG